MKNENGNGKLVCANCDNETENVNMICDLCAEHISKIPIDEMKSCLVSDIRINKQSADWNSDPDMNMDMTTDIINRVYRMAFILNCITETETKTETKMKNETEPKRCAVCGDIIIGHNIDDDNGFNFCSMLHYHFHTEIRTTMDHIMETEIACLCNYPDHYDFNIDPDLIYTIDDEMIRYLTEYKNVLDCIINTVLKQ